MASDDDSARAAAAVRVLAGNPEFAASQEAGVRAALDDGDPARADEALRLGLAVVPGHLGLLSLRPVVAQHCAEALPEPGPSRADADEDAALDREILAAEAAAAHEFAVDEPAPGKRKRR